MARRKIITVTEPVEEETEIIETETSPHPVLDKAKQLISLLFSIAQFSLALQLMFVAFRARSVGIVDLIQSINEPYLSLFRGLVPTFTVGPLRIDSSIILAMIALLIIEYLLLNILSVLAQPYTVHSKHAHYRE